MSDQPASDPSPARSPHSPGRVVLLSGPSGAGKSRLAHRLRDAHGWPILRLDDFYRDEDDPDLPLSAELGIPDWDDVRSWHTDHAVDALEALMTRGHTEVPTYDISTSRRVGTFEIACSASDLVVAEGIFAAHLTEPLRERGLLHSSWCVRRSPNVAFGLRLVRDLRERRKPPLTLVRRGLALRRGEGAIVAAQEQLGATPATPAQVYAALSPRA